MDEQLRAKLIRYQNAEITEHHVYRALAGHQEDPENRRTLERIAEDEKRHHDFWAEHTGQSGKVNRLEVWRFGLLAWVLGLTFTLRLMERGEEQAQESYAEVIEAIPEAQSVLEDESDHESELVGMLDEEALEYVGAVVLGLSDALVELTGALAGLTLAVRDSRLIGVIGLITGIAAAMSMAASNYLSTKADGTDDKSPVKSAFYTGGAYIGTVGLLVLPFLLLAQPLAALGVTLATALVIIAAFTYYVAVARAISFAGRFLEMAGLSLGVAAVSFAIGFVVRIVFGVDV